MATNEMLSQIDEGLDVLDNTGEKLGTVAEVHFAETNAASPSDSYQEQMDSGIDELLTGLGGNLNTIPEEVRERLEMEGFVRIERGMAEADAFVFANEIDHVDEHVHLSVPEGDLVSTNL